MIKQTIKTSDLFFCYSEAMCGFLVYKGFRYFIRAIHPETHKLFRVFQITPELQKAIDEFNESTRG